MNNWFMRIFSHDLGHFLKKGWLLVCLLCFLLLLLCLGQVQSHGLNPSAWDLLLLSGVATFILGIYLWLDIPRNLETMLLRLLHRGTLDVSEEKLRAFEVTLHAKADRWAQYAGVLIALATLLAFVIAFKFPLPSNKILITTLEVIGAYIAGSFLGRMACYGALGWLLHQQQIPLKLQPGHLDGVAGLKPIGDFYFKQARVVAVPATFLAVWLLIIQLQLINRYSNWRAPYAGLLGIVLVFEVLTFLLPLWSFHQEMVLQKTRHLERADELSQEIDRVQLILTTEQDAQRRELLKDRLSSMTKQYWNIENLPTWPVAIQTRRLFTRNNLALVLPLILELLSNTDLGKSPWWQTTVKAMEKITGH